MGGGSASRIFFDFHCAPPKSVSILAVTMDDRRVLQAHREASTIALREPEQFTAVFRLSSVESSSDWHLNTAEFEHSGPFLGKRLTLILVFMMMS